MAENNDSTNYAPLFKLGQMTDPNTNAAIDLDDLFNDIYYMDLPPSTVDTEDDIPGAAPTTAATPAPAAAAAAAAAPTPAPAPAAATNNNNDTKPAPRPVAPPSNSAALTGAAASSASTSSATKRTAEAAGLGAASAAVPSAVLSQNSGDNSDDAGKGGELTEQQKIERRERNREHAKRSRLRKKFLLESLQEQIHGLEEQLDGLKKALQQELPEKAESIIATVCGDKEKYTPLPMPSGFGPVKTLMEPDFRLMSALSGSQQNFAISDPTLPDNPIVYVSQGFLDLTGYTLDQVLGRNCRFLQGPGTDQSAVEVIRRGIAEGVDTSVCLLNYKADGTPFWNQFFVAALRDAENNVVNYVGVQCEVSKAVVEKQMAEQKKKAAPT